jgi:uncharacterized protein with HEPN domain
MLIEAEEDQDWEVAKTAFDSILYDLVVIGEAVKTFKEDFKQRHAGIPWVDIAGMRDILTHEYFRVNSKVVRATIDSPLANLRVACAVELGM